LKPERATVQATLGIRTVIYTKNIGYRPTCRPMAPIGVTLTAIVCDVATSEIFLCLLSVQCNAGHWTDIKSLEFMFVCLSVCLCLSAFRNTIRPHSAQGFYPIFFRFKTWSHMNQRRPSLMANNTGSSERACASIYFRFSSF